MSMRRLNGEHARRRKMRATAQLVANMQATLLLEQTSDTARLAAPNSRHALLGMTRIESAKRKNLVRPMKRGRQRKAGAVAQAIRDSQRRTRLHNSFRCLPHGIVRRNAFYVSRTAFFTLTGSRHEKNISSMIQFLHRAVILMKRQKPSRRSCAVHIPPPNVESFDVVVSRRGRLLSFARPASLYRLRSTRS